LRGIFFEKPGLLELRDNLPKPQVNENEVLIKVKNCGICGSDVSSYKIGTMSSQQIILGHEFSGEIIEIGTNVQNAKIGDRVTANPNIPCLECYFCKQGLENMCVHNTKGVTHDGALAEYITVRVDRLHHLPDTISYEQGALVEPLSNAVYAVKNVHFGLGSNAAVYGAGTIGLLVSQVLSSVGASYIYIIEPIESKRNLALDLGADYSFEPKKQKQIFRMTHKIGVDYIFDCVGIPDTIMNSYSLIKRGGTIMLIGMYTDPFEIKGWLQITSKNLTIKGMYLSNQDAFKTAIRLIEQQKVNVAKLITKRVKLEDVPKEYAQLASGIHENIKVMVEID
jgi:2-desacetyl-2-hydroxyethyl bacteriochlorophyllide A dehydrogenase